MSTRRIDRRPARRVPAEQTVAAAVALAIYGASAYGQAPGAALGEVEVIVVTGSYIAGAAEDAALPIDVLTADELLKQGSPSMTELIKALP
ncbi:MAG: hypothetical protein SXG53_23305, partial [Pseudomonadota bacterium]|nr:hypothetical protein [Pseudomonadota bacterium]